MLEVIASPIDGKTGPDWHHIWRNSPEHRAVKEELRRLRALGASTDASTVVSREGSQHQEFVASSWTQYREVMVRTSKHFWRSPTYIWSKIILITLAVSHSNFNWRTRLTFWPMSLSISASASQQATLSRDYRISFGQSLCFLSYLSISTSKSCPCLYHSGHSMRHESVPLRCTDGLVSEDPT